MNCKQEFNLTGLILEGISGTGKTSLLRGILAHPVWQNKNSLSSVVLTEHQTQRVLERKAREEGLVLNDHLNLLGSHIGYLEDLNAQLDQMQWCQAGQTAMRIPFLLERFHLTHGTDYNHITWSHLESLDSRLAPLNGKIVLLTASPAALKQRLFSRRNEAWRSYIQRFGSTPGEILDYYVSRQEQLIHLADKSCLEVMRFDTSRLGVAEIVDQILSDWSSWLS